MSEKTEKLADEHCNYLLEKENVVGVGGGEDKLVVLVTEKKEINALSKEDVVDSYLDGVKTDVIEVGKIEAKLSPGTSIGLRNAGTGTAGAVVRDRQGIRYILTNNHVAADNNRALALSVIHSPGPADNLGKRIGRLGRFEPIWFDRVNYIDAALVRLDVAPNYSTHSDWTLTPRVGWHVEKVGRTTGHTTGTVIALNVTVDVSMGSQGTARFSNQIMTDYMLDSGDSGSLLTSRGQHPVGLGFAGSYTVSFHNPIQRVLDTLFVRF